MAIEKFLNHTLQSSTYGAVINGQLEKRIMSKIIYVSSEDDLALLADEKPGTFAATYGFTNLWQMDDNGEFIAIL